MVRRSAPVLWLLLAAVAVHSALGSGVPQHDGGEDSMDAKRALAEKQYKKAISIRDSPSSTAQELDDSVNLLLGAAGIDAIRVGKEEGGDSKGALPELLTRRDVVISSPEGAVQNNEALRELVALYLSGETVPPIPAVADALLRRLAAGGLPEAQTDTAMHEALGLELAAPGPGNPTNALFALRQPDVARALVGYEFGAKGGDAPAMMALGFRHLYGLGVPRDCAAAALHYEPAALQVVKAAASSEGLPKRYSLRLGAGAPPVSQQVDRNYDPLQEALHYQWFADFGHADAARAVAIALADGDDPRAARYLRQAAEAGDPEAQARLGHAYLSGTGVDANNETAIHWLKQAARKGAPSALLGLGVAHLEGIGAPKSFEQAHALLRRAVDAAGAGGQAWEGLSEAYFYLGLMHLRGWGVSPNLAAAAEHWELAARHGHVLAGYNLAMLHLGNHTSSRRPCRDAVWLLKAAAERGTSMLQEAHEDWLAGEPQWALLTYLKAAETGILEAQLNAAWLLGQGYGGPDQAVADRLAVELASRAAAQGSVVARRTLGDAAWQGRGLPQDPAAAARRYAEAASGHDAQSMFDLALLHAAGVGVPRDMHLAKRYLDRARETDPDHAAVAVALAGAAFRFVEWWSAVAPGTLAQLPRRWLDAALALPEPRGSTASSRSTWLGLRLLNVADAAIMDFSSGDVLLIMVLAASSISLILAFLSMRPARPRP